MEPAPITLVIDAFQHSSPFEAAGGMPPVVQTLQSADARADLIFNPPVILCDEADMARARGAFLVSGDGDGRIIALDVPGTPEHRRQLLWGPRLLLLAAGEAFPDDPVTEHLENLKSVDLLPASLKGVWVPEPSAWRTLCDSET